MSKMTSWQTSSTYARKATNARTADSLASDKWHVDTYPLSQTRSVKVSYGELKVVKWYGK